MEPLRFWQKDSDFRNAKVMPYIRNNIDDDHLPISEIFLTIEGEGSFIGTPRVLARVGGCPIGCHWCFTAPTPVLTKKGNVPIKDIKVGDIIITYNNVDNVLEEVPVENVLIHEVYSNKLVKVSFNPERKGKIQSVICTEDHPFILSGSLMTCDAGHLLEGDSIVYIDGKNGITFADVVSVVPIVKTSPILTPVYNLTIPKFSTYIANGVLVHNCDSPQTFGIKSNPILSLDEVVDQIIEVSGGKVREVSITGGEPMLYPKQIKIVADKLRSKGFNMWLETSGELIDSEVFSVFNYISLDIKTPSSGITLKPEQFDTYLKVAMMHKGVQFKVVVSNEEDLDWIEDNLKPFFHKHSQCTPLILTPCADPKDFTTVEGLEASYKKIISMVLEWNQGYNIRVIPQIHKMLDLR